ncbi:MAG: UDP-N-acetylmuramoyl-tripeptide--D-alanyl-D-alanine ligase, partial [Clostridia bacterium]|nr:UDP-N-acetylmuramoyl-tripeptide--D-alanyl-D-alanine ligase [Clostridia bacterium]
MKVQIGVGGMEIKEMAAFCGGTVIGAGSVSSLCTDSREATDGQTLFAAIVGERVDGHDYMRRAYDSGCRFFLCQRIPEELSGCEFGAVVVTDTVKALGDIASAYAARLGHPSVGVTGSVGKTTTKEFICA